MKAKKDGTVPNVFQKIIRNSKWKPNKTWADQGNKPHNSSLNHGEMTMIYSTYHKRNSAVAEKLIKVLRNNIYRHMYQKIFILMC